MANLSFHQYYQWYNILELFLSMQTPTRNLITYSNFILQFACAFISELRDHNAELDMVAIAAITQRKTQDSCSAWKHWTRNIPNSALLYLYKMSVLYLSNITFIFLCYLQLQLKQWCLHFLFIFCCCCCCSYPRCEKKEEEVAECKSVGRVWGRRRKKK